MDFTELETVLKEKFPGISQDKMEKFRKLEPLYRDWNSKINVISRKDIDMLYLHHVLHSLAIAEYIRACFPEQYEVMAADAREGVQDTCRILDVGTGGGFPGIPLAIMFPSVRFTLCDSIGKKIIVTSEVAKALELGNVETVNARAESLRGRYDYVVSRAVTSLENFLPWVKGKYSKGILYLKGGDVVEEVTRAAGLFRLRNDAVSLWPIGDWLKDPYFDSKLVIFIRA